MRKFLLSLDGLSAEDLKVLQSSSTSLNAFAQNGHVASFDAGILTCAQPIWSEILTGEPWHKNGCSGYAKPSGSLNRLSIFSEKDLLVPTALLAENSEASRTVTINIPLLLPSDQRRVWLSDGSLPINKTVSPSKILSKPKFESYTPRPFADIGKSMEGVNQSAVKFINNEIRRLELALELFENSDWDIFLFRISAFDHLSHLLGLNFLRAKDLQISDAIKQLINRLDTAISVFASCSDVQLIVMSSYSHIPCRGTLNLNTLLEQSGFLQLESDVKMDRNNSQRINAMKAITAAPIASQLASTEGMLAGAKTIAASPISGSVFINRNTFEDGAVSEQEYDEMRLKLGMFLQDSLSKRFGSGFSINERPNHQDSFHSAEIPEFMIKIEGIEFRNMQETAAGRVDVPRTTHSSAGFIVMPKVLATSKSVHPVQMCDIFS